MLLYGATRLATLDASIGHAMTYRYEWNPMPREVAVACPECGKEAAHESARWAAIRLKKDIPFFKRSRVFEYVHDPSPTGFSHFALYFPRLHGPVEAVGKLPEGYKPEDWSPSRYGTPFHSRLGTIYCPACGLLRRHCLDWPKEAFYQVDIRGRTLWAFNRAYAQELQDYIQSKDRDRRRYKSRLALDVIPKHFMTAKVRNEAAKKLGKLLGIA